MNERHHIEEIGDMEHADIAMALLDQIEANVSHANAYNAGLTRMGALYRAWAQTEPTEREQHAAIDSMRVDLGRVNRDLRDQPDLFIDSWPSKHHGTA